MKPERKPMLIRGNTHLGADFWTFSLPARATCKPGMTGACEGVCYALNFVFLTKSASRKHLENFERAKDTVEFANDMIAEIRYRRARKVRVHVAGDFFSIEYARAWASVMKRCKTTEFLFYTRSWRAAELRDILAEMASLKNVHAFWSEDRDTGASDLPHGRRAFLCTNLQDELLVPPGLLVFRQRTKPVRKFINDSWVCAKEQGTTTSITCSTCLVCVRPGPLPVAPERRGRDGSASSPGES